MSWEMTPVRFAISAAACSAAFNGSL
jgi:hypothetical protein